MLVQVFYLSNSLIQLVTYINSSYNSRLASTAGYSPLSFLTTNESVVLSQEDHQPNTQESEILNRDRAMDSKVSTGKRRSTSDSETGSTLHKKSNQQTYPPLFPSARTARSRHIVSPHHWNQTEIHQTPKSQVREERSNEEEQKNVQVMLNCILGMLEKTQRAITILQQRQTTPANIRTTEEIVDAVQEKAKVEAIMEVKQAFLEAITRAAGDGYEENE